MYSIFADNVNEALYRGVHYLWSNGVKRESRNGTVVVSPIPVTTIYQWPMQRVLFSPVRDANPFFHLIESLWMLAGRDDLATLTPLVAKMKDFSDDGKTIPGAYGKRWRCWFNDPHRQDQLSWAIRRLAKDHNDRRVVIQMWDAGSDPWKADLGGKDVPCNLVITPWINEGTLDMSVFCRSNDIIWGAYGANAVHFTILQEYLAAGIGVPVGRFYQISNNFHAYMNVLEKLGEPKEFYNKYFSGNVAPYPLFNRSIIDATNKQFDEDLTIFFDEPAAPGLRSNFLRKVACPMLMAHRAYKKKNDPERFITAQEIIAQCVATDWRLAGSQWLYRREAELHHAKDDGVKYDI